MNKLTLVKNLVVRNERKILVAALAITSAGTALMVRNQRVTNDFLREHNLLEAYYNSGE